MNNIILCGFMGCGKTTVGKQLAKKTGMKFIDMDEYIEEKAGMTVKEIFAEQGEQGFRDMEHDACTELARESNRIIAAGGGTLTFQRNVEVLRQTGTIVLIDADFNHLYQRLKHDTARPLLQCENRGEKIKAMLRERMPLYKKAARVTVNGNFSAGKVAREIIAEVNKLNSG